MNKNILVTGGAGFIGSNFALRATDLYNNVIVLDRLTYASNVDNLDHDSVSGKKIRFFVGDINDQEMVSGLLRNFNIQYLVNFAAETHVDNSIKDPAPFIRSNIDGVFNLLHAATGYWSEDLGGDREKFRFVQISTDEVYGSSTNQYFTEDFPLRPNSPYAASKASSDMLVRAWNKTYGLPTITTHCVNNYGPKQHHEKLIPHMVKCALAGKPLPVYGDGLNRRSWIHVDDHVDGILQAIQSGEPGDIYDFGGEEISNIDMVRLICQCLDDLSQWDKKHEELIAFVADRPGHDFRYAVDDMKARIKLGFSPRTQLARGIRDTVKWYIANRPWEQN